MKIELTEDQLRIINSALDLYSRCLIGQFEEVADLALMYNVTALPERDWEALHEFKEDIRTSKTKLGFARTGSFGIYSPEVHDNARISYDMLQVIRNHLSWKYHKEGESTMYVNYDTPMKTGKADFIKIEDPDFKR